jgi:hypothetical protein
VREGVVRPTFLTVIRCRSIRSWPFRPKPPVVAIDVPRAASASHRLKVSS